MELLLMVDAAKRFGKINCGCDPYFDNDKIEKAARVSIRQN